MDEHRDTNPLPRIYLHIGTHRTGSTSLQAYLGQHRQQLAAQGIEYYRGALLADNHIELYLSAIDPDKDTFATSRMAISPGEDFTRRTRAAVHAFLATSRARTVIFSTEGLSLLRKPEELARLGTLFDPATFQVTIVLVLRERASYLASYRRQILKVPGRAVSSNPNSALYVESDSWLADYDSLISAYANLYAAENIRIVDYDEQVARSGDVLPAVLAALSVPAHLIPPPGVTARENRSSWKASVKRLLLRMLDRA